MSLPVDGLAGLGLDPRLTAALAYAAPTPIQRTAISVLLAGRDLVGLASTGTGKTAAFALPLLHRLAAGPAAGAGPAVLILTPTRELAVQVAKAVAAYGRPLGTRVLAVYGGAGYADQTRSAPPEDRRRVGARPTRSGMAKVFFGIGRDARVTPKDLVGAICNEAGVPGRDLGAIDLTDRFALVEVPADLAGYVVEAIQGARIRGRTVHVRPDRPVPAPLTPIVRHRLASGQSGQPGGSLGPSRQRVGDRSRREPGQPAAPSSRGQLEL